ncbi:MAG: transporter [Leptothrix sp. (in: Bacteria)]|nr:transporter [Leptothrix sp. (in: b-proteobacteria)]
MTLQAVLEALVVAYGWDGLGERIPLRCFTHDPSMASSLKFLRKTPWAREKAESLYAYLLREQRRQAQPGTAPR